MPLPVLFHQNFPHDLQFSLFSLWLVGYEYPLWLWEPGNEVYETISIGQHILIPHYFIWAWNEVFCVKPLKFCCLSATTTNEYYHRWTSIWTWLKPRKFCSSFLPLDDLFCACGFGIITWIYNESIPVSVHSESIILLEALNSMDRMLAWAMIFSTLFDIFELFSSRTSEKLVKHLKT